MAEQYEEPEQRWYETLQEAADAALDAAEESGEIELRQPKELVFLGQKGNPIHEYRAKLKTPE
jgi:hypothetical protein